METCKEFGIRYYEYPTFWGAIQGNIDLLRELGKKPVAYGGDGDFKCKLD